MDLLIVGLDGLSYNMLQRFDVNPEYLSSVRREGVSGDLASVDTPTTLPAWTSFATGTDPGTHGIATMTRQEPDYSTGPARTNTTEPTAYDLLADALFVNLPASNGRVPAANGTSLVSAMLAKDEADAVPDDLKDLDAYDDYVLDHDASLKVRPRTYLRHVEDIVDARHRFAREAFETRDPRVGFVLFSATDWAGHILSNLSDDAMRREVYDGLVTRVDEKAADLADLADNVVLMSDHGFEHKHTNVHVAEWLGASGYFVEGEGDTSPADVAVSVAKRVASRSDRLYAAMRRVFNHVMGTSVGAAIDAAAKPDVDYERSRAWEVRYGCVYVNDDRFESPTVDDAGALRREMRDGLAALTDDDGDPIFREVALPDQAYADPGEWAPDVIARPAPGCFPTSLSSPTGGYASPTDNYEHRYRGIFAATGPLFEGDSVEGMTIVDVLPTVMAALGEPLSPTFDGDVRTDVLATDGTPPTLGPEEVPVPRVEDEAADEQSDREATVERRLEDLGYIE
jgi:predicted AlkP superfamily phosphohydrolase/phosphomutase